jgi:hypothetical protein
MSWVNYLDPQDLPPKPDPETGLPEPPRAPGLTSSKLGKPDPARVTDPAHAPEPPRGQGPVLAWYQPSERGALTVGAWGFALMVVGVTLLQGFSIAWMRFWWAWVGLLVFAALIYLTQRAGRCSAGAEWVRGRKNWVRTYELTKVKASFSPSGTQLTMRDQDGRTLSISLSRLKDDRKIWDLVYNGILHSVIAGGADTNGHLHRDLAVPYPQTN